MRIWTIGHADWPIESFISALKVHGIQLLADTRQAALADAPPAYQADALANILCDNGIVRVPLPGLDGGRSPRPDSPHQLLKDPDFRGYADHMETDEFRDAVERLMELARSKPTAVLCARAQWWRCHRMLLADYLMALGVEVIHILGDNKTEQHHYTAGARFMRGKISYRPHAD